MNLLVKHLIYHHSSFKCPYPLLLEEAPGWVEVPAGASLSVSRKALHGVVYLRDNGSRVVTEAAAAAAAAVVAIGGVEVAASQVHHHHRRIQQGKGGLRHPSPVQAGMLAVLDRQQERRRAGRRAAGN